MADAADGRFTQGTVSVASFRPRGTPSPPHPPGATGRGLPDLGQGGRRRPRSSGPRRSVAGIRPGPGQLDVGADRSGRDHDLPGGCSRVGSRSPLLRHLGGTCTWSPMPHGWTPRSGWSTSRRSPSPSSPDAVSKVRWDVVVVDGPYGWVRISRAERRASPWLGQLVTPGGIVIVDDYDRAVERHACDLVFGRPGGRAPRCDATSRTVPLLSGPSRAGGRRTRHFVPVVLKFTITPRNLDPGTSPTIG